MGQLATLSWGHQDDTSQLSAPATPVVQDTSPAPPSLAKLSWGAPDTQTPTPTTDTNTLAPKPMAQDNTAQPKLATLSWGSPNESVQKNDSSTSTTPTNTPYNIDQAKQDPQLQQALQSYYGRDGSDTSDPNALTNRWLSDQRTIGSNSVYAALQLKEAINLRDAGDNQQLGNLAIMRDTFEKLPSLVGSPIQFAKEGTDAISGVWHDAVDAASDPVNILTAFTVGALGPEGVAAKTAVMGATDFVIGASFNAASQKTDIAIDPDKRFNDLEVLESGAMNAALPMAISAGVKGVAMARDISQVFLTNRSQKLAEMPEDASKWVGKFLTTEDIEKERKGITINHMATGDGPTLLRSRDDMMPVTDAKGNEMVFRNPLEAAQYYKNNFKPDTVLTDPQALESLSNPNDPNNSHWIISKKFNTISDAKSYIKDTGEDFGSASPSDYFTSSNGVSGVKGGMTDTFGLFVQRNVDQFYGKRITEADANKVLQAELENPNITQERATAIRAAMMGPSAVQVAENAMNANAIAEHFIGNLKTTDEGNTYYGSRPYLADDPNMAKQIANDPNLSAYYRSNANAAMPKAYLLDTTKKSLLGIIVDANQKLTDQGVTEPNFGQELFKYMLARRVIDKELDPIGPVTSGKHTGPINTGLVLKEAQDFVHYIENDPYKANVYTDAAEQIRDFNKDLLQFAVDHHTMSADDMQNTIGKSRYYMPIRRAENLTEGYFALGKGAAADTTRKALSDNDKPRGQSLIDPQQAYIEEAYAIIRNAVDNRANLLFYKKMEAAGTPFADQVFTKGAGAKPINLSVGSIKEALQDAGINIDVDDANKSMLTAWVKNKLLADRPGSDIVFENGKPVLYEAKNIYLKDALTLAGSNLSQIVERANALGVSKFARNLNGLYSAMLTHDPTVNTASFLVSDSIGSFLMNPTIGKNWSTFVTNLPFINAARGMATSMASKEYQEAALNGATLSGLVSTANQERNMIKLMREHGLSAQDTIGVGITTDSKNLQKFYSATVGWSGLHQFAKRTEGAVRFNQYINGITDGQSYAEAANLGAKSSIDFRLRGTSDASTEFQRTFFPPFTRAMFNSLYQVGRAYTVDGKDTATRWAKMLIPVAATLSLEHALKDNVEYQNTDDLKKDLWWYVPVPSFISENGMIRIRKPHEQAIPANIIRYWLNEMNKSEEGRPIASMVTSYAFQQILLNARSESPIGMLTGFAPQPLQGALQVMLNQNTLGGQLNSQTESGGLPSHEGQYPHVHWLLQTPGFEAALQAFNEGPLTNFSATPKDVEVILNSLFGAAMGYAWQVSDAAYMNSKGIYQFKANSLPLVSRIYQPDRPVRNSGLEEQLYNYDRYVQGLSNDMTLAPKFANVDRMQADAELMGDPQYQKYMQVKDLVKQGQHIVSQSNQRITDMYQTGTNNPRMEDDVDDQFKARNEVLKQIVYQIKGIMRTNKPMPGAKAIQDWMKPNDN